MTDGDEAAAAAAPQSPKERRLKLMLIASLAFNLLVVGAVAGAMIFGPHGPRVEFVIFDWAAARPILSCEAIEC